MIWMLIVGYVFAIRSERRLCAEARVNLAYRWLCGLSIDDRIPDHLAFSRVCYENFRQAEVLRQVFESVVESTSTCLCENIFATVYQCVKQHPEAVED